MYTFDTKRNRQAKKEKKQKTNPLSLIWANPIYKAYHGHRKIIYIRSDIYRFLHSFLFFYNNWLYAYHHFSHYLWWKLERERVWSCVWLIKFCKQAQGWQSNCLDRWHNSSFKKPSLELHDNGFWFRLELRKNEAEKY